MNKEIQSIITTLENVLSNEPWYGKSVYEILKEAGTCNVYMHPEGTSHSMIELLYHLITWTEFTLSSLKHEDSEEISTIESLDWRSIDPKEHSWEKGFAQFKIANEKVIELLQAKDDKFLEENVHFRKYNFRFLLNGLIQHHIYHIGQIAFIKNLYK
jgi:hypothetical protein